MTTQPPRKTPKRPDLTHRNPIRRIARCRRPKARTLIINSYGGSLVIAAHARGNPVIGSYEDAGYGLPIQQRNFPGLDYRATRDEWPDQDLSDALVIAHPPCAAFSAQNYSNDASKRGVDAAKFQCTIGVLEYALGARCAGLAVESVVGAYEGAKEVHERAAAKHGYHLFRVLQNAVTFGVPQWRERFWAIFVRKDLLPTGALVIDHTPVPCAVADVLEAAPGPADPKLERKWAEQGAKLTEAFGAKAARELMRGVHGPGALGGVLKRWLNARSPGERHDLREVSKQHIVHGSFESETPRVLDVRAPAPTLLHHSFWTYNGRVLSMREYQRLMGFPDNYVFPDKFKRRQREFLSRGVCPPVALWVLDTLDRNCFDRVSYFARPAKDRKRDFRPREPAFLLEAGGTADLRPSKAMWAEFVGGGHAQLEVASC